MICGRSIGLGCDAGSRSVEAFASLVPLCSGPTVPMLVDTTAVSVAFFEYGRRSCLAATKSPITWSSIEDEFG